MELNLLKVILGIKYIKLFLELNILKIMIGIKLNKFIFISFSKLYKDIVLPYFKITFSIKKIGHPLKLLKSINKSIITFYILIFIFFRGAGLILFHIQ